MNLKTQNLKLDFSLSLRERVRPALSTVEGVRVEHLRFPHLPIHLFTCLIFFALLTAALPAKSYADSWAKTYGREYNGLYDDSANSIQLTADGGYIMTARGWTYFDILKVNGDGSVAWRKWYDKNSYEVANSIGITADGGYIVAGDDTYGGGVWIIKLNNDGTVAWQKSYGNSNTDHAYSIQQTTDGGYIVAGSTESFGAGSSDAWILKLNNDGTIGWQKTYGTSGSDYAKSVQQTSDGGYIVAGSLASNNDFDYWILKLNSNGTIAWQNTYGALYHNYAESIQQTSDGYIVAGHYDPGLGNPVAIKLNNDGTIAWQKYFSGISIQQIRKTSDGGYIAAGSIANDALLLKLNSDGTVAWQKRYGGTLTDYATSVQQTPDGGYIVAGAASSFSGFPNRYYPWVLKVNSDGTVPSLGVNASVTVSTASFTVGAPGITVNDTNVVPVATSGTILDVTDIVPTTSSLSAPSNISVDNPGVSGQLWVTWSNPADSNFNHTHIYRSTSAGTKGDLIADNLSGIKYTDTGLSSLTTYYYTVRAVDAAGNETINTTQYSATTSDATPPAVPSNVTATNAGTGGKINLSWTNPADSDLAQIKVYRSTAFGTLGSAVCIVSKPTASCSDTGLTNGTTYYYTVRAVDTSSNETTNTAQVSAIPSAPDTTPPGISNTVTVTDTAAGGTLTVSWTWGGTLDSDLDYLRIYRSTTSGQLGTLVYDHVLKTATSLTDTGLTNNSTYYYTIRSVDTSGNESINTNQGSGTPTDTVSPKPVSNLTATLLSGGQVRLDWIRSASTDTNYYNIYSDNGTGTINYATSAGRVAHPTVTWTSGALTTGTAYKFAVRAEDTAQLEETNTNVVVNVVPVSNTATSGVKAYVSSPVTGQKIGGSRVTVAAGLLTGARTDVNDIRFQYKPVSSGTWTDITTADAGYPNPDTTEPWYFYWNVSGVTNGDYLLRAVATNTSLVTDNTPSYITVAVDNAAAEATETTNAQSEPVKQQDVSVNTTNNLTVGSESGVISLTIPETALSSDTEVNVTVADPVVRSISVPYVSGDVFLDITLNSGQATLENNKEAVITVPYKDDNNDNILDGTSTNVYNLKVMWWNTTASAWEKLDSVVDTTNKVVKGKTNHFSLFGLLAPPNPTVSGWNLISVPLQPVPNNSWTIFGQTPYVYNPTTQSYYSPETVTPGLAYWIQGGANLTATGTETPTTGNFSISIKKGWNMIGNPFRFNVKLSDINVSYNSTIYTMSQAETNGYLIGTVYPYINGVYQFINASDGGEMEPWVGYWILSDKDMTLLVPPTPAQ